MEGTLSQCPGESKLGGSVAVLQGRELCRGICTGWSPGPRTIGSGSPRPRAGSCPGLTTTPNPWLCPAPDPHSLACFLHACIARDFLGQGSSAVGMEGGASATTAVGATTHQVCVLWGSGTGETQQHLTCPLSTRDIHTAAILDKDKDLYLKR